MPEEKQETLNTEGKPISWAACEVIRKDASRNTVPFSGLFRGVKVRTNGQTGNSSELLKLIVLGKADKPADMRAYNSEVFNVLSLTAKYGDTKELIVFRNDEIDQKKAFQLLAALTAQLREENKMLSNDAEIVDIAKFKDLPDEYGKGESSTKANTNVSNLPRQNTFSRHQPHTANNGVYHKSTTSYDYTKRREEEEHKKKLRLIPMLFKRKSELPTSEALEAMKTNVLAIAKGEYEAPEYLSPDPIDNEPDDFTNCNLCKHSTTDGERSLYDTKCKACNGKTNFEDYTSYTSKNCGHCSTCVNSTQAGLKNLNLPACLSCGDGKNWQRDDYDDYYFHGMA